MKFEPHDSEWEKTAPTTDKSVRFQQQLNVNASATTRAWLRVSDVVEHVALWLDDRYLGDPETPFQPRVLELPDGTKDAMLSVEFVQLDDIRLPRIQLIKTGPIRIGRHKVLCAEADHHRGSLEIHVELDTNIATLAWIRTVIADQKGTVVVDDARRHAIAVGRNRLRWRESLDEPHLWQKGDGAESLYTATTSVGVYEASETSDTATTTTGFRSVTRERETLRINGNLQPMVFLAMDRPPWPTADSRSIVRLTSVNDSEAYDDADQKGVLLCQRLPEDMNHARQVVDLLAHHPSIIAWSRPRRALKAWRPNGDTVRRVADRADGTRPFLFE